MKKFIGKINGTVYTSLQEFEQAIEKLDSSKSVNLSYNYYSSEDSKEDCKKELLEDCKTEQVAKDETVLTQEIFESYYKLPENVLSYVWYNNPEKNQKNKQAIEKFVNEAIPDTEQFKYADEDLVKLLNDLQNYYGDLSNETERLIHNLENHLQLLGNQFDKDTSKVNLKLNIDQLTNQINYLEALGDMYSIYFGYYFELYNLYTGEIVNYL
jgi:hypothetical protein